VRTLNCTKTMMTQAIADLSERAMHEEVLFRLRQTPKAYQDYFHTVEKARASANLHAKRLIWC
jgi:hypothetical protein